MGDQPLVHMTGRLAGCSSAQDGAGRRASHADLAAAAGALEPGPLFDRLHAGGSQPWERDRHHADSSTRTPVLARAGGLCRVPVAAALGAGFDWPRMPGYRPCGSLLGPGGCSSSSSPGAPMACVWRSALSIGEAVCPLASTNGPAAAASSPLLARPSVCPPAAGRRSPWRANRARRTRWRSPGAAVSASPGGAPRQTNAAAPMRASRCRWACKGRLRTGCAIGSAMHGIHPTPAEFADGCPDAVQARHLQGCRLWHRILVRCVCRFRHAPGLSQTGLSRCLEDAVEAGIGPSPHRKSILPGSGGCIHMTSISAGSCSLATDPRPAPRRRSPRRRRARPAG